MKSKLVSWLHADRVMHFLVDADAEIGDNKHTVETSDASLIIQKIKCMGCRLTEEDALGKVFPRSNHNQIGSLL